MTSRYEYKDPIFRESTKYAQLRLGNNNPLLNVYRMLLGTINIEDQFSNRTFRLRTNYCIFSFIENKIIIQKKLIEPFPDEIRLADLNRFFARTRSNIKFYKSIEPEILKCLLAEKQGNYLESFFYLYRVIEGISYTLPLIYVSKNNSFDKSYKTLQSFFAKDVDGELKFFKRFISETFNDEDFYKSNIRIDLNEIEFQDLKEKYYEVLISKIDRKRIFDSTEGEEIVVTFIGFYEMIIELRNRFFHFTKGSWQENISSSQIIYPDFFFKPIVKHGINWVAIILVEIIKFDFEQGNN